MRGEDEGLPEQALATVDRAKSSTAPSPRVRGEGWGEGLRDSVAVLEAAGMIEWDKVQKWAHCDVRIINRPIPKTDFTGDL